MKCFRIKVFYNGSIFTSLPQKLDEKEYEEFKSFIEEGVKKGFSSLQFKTSDGEVFFSTEVLNKSVIQLREQLINQ